MQYVELRHMAEVKGNMAVSETEYVATANWKKKQNLLLRPFIAMLKP